MQRPGRLAGDNRAAGSQLRLPHTNEGSHESLGPGGWSRKQILGHLIDSASNNHQRFVRALLDREVHLANYDQEGWVRVHAYQELDWRRLVSFWAAYNRLLWEVLERMPPDRLSIPCHIGDDPPAPLRNMVDGYVDHLKHHLEQIVDGITGPAR